MNFEDPGLSPILEKLAAVKPLGREDARTLYETHDLLGLGQLAHSACERRHGKRAWCVQDAAPPIISAAHTVARIESLLKVQANALDVYEPELREDLSGFAFLKDVAVARLMLHQAVHIRVRLCRQVENLCQMALRFGADTLAGENLAEIERQARAAGREIAT